MNEQIWNEAVFKDLNDFEITRINAAMENGDLADFEPYSLDIDNTDEETIVCHAMETANNCLNNCHVEEKEKGVKMDFDVLTKTMPIKVLLKIGRAVASTDYAVRFFYSKNHKKFYKNIPALRKAVRRAYAVNAFDHRQRIQKIVEDWKD